MPLPRPDRRSRLPGITLPPWLATLKKALVIIGVALLLSALWGLGVLKLLELIEAILYRF